MSIDFIKGLKIDTFTTQWFENNNKGKHHGKNKNIKSRGNGLGK